MDRGALQLARFSTIAREEEPFQTSRLTLSFLGAYVVEL